METGENLILNVNENSSVHLTNNNNSISLNCSTTVATDDVHTSGIIQKENGFDDSVESQSHGTSLDTSKSNYHELIGVSENCDTKTNDCDAKTILNNNDLAIGFVDDDDETADVEGGANNIDNFNQCNAVEATKGHANAIGQYTYNIYKSCYHAFCGVIVVVVAYPREQLS